MVKMGTTTMATTINDDVMARMMTKMQQKFNISKRCDKQRFENAVKAKCYCHEHLLVIGESPCHCCNYPKLSGIKISTLKRLSGTIRNFQKSHLLKVVRNSTDTMSWASYFSFTIRKLSGYYPDLH